MALTAAGLDETALLHVLERYDPRFIVEVGSWKGLSAIAMAKWLQQRVVAGSAESCGLLLCVDTWLGTCRCCLSL